MSRNEKKGHGGKHTRPKKWSGNDGLVLYSHFILNAMFGAHRNGPCYWYIWRQFFKEIIGKKIILWSFS